MIWSKMIQLHDKIQDDTSHDKIEYDTIQDDTTYDMIESRNVTPLYFSNL